MREATTPQLILPLRGRPYNPPMAGTRRPPELVASLEARARRMRAEGHRMADISRAVGVPTPTLYQWAARGQWRLEDMAEPVAAGPDIPAPEADTAIDEDAEPPTALEAAQAVLELAGLEAARGQLVRSERAAKLARQLFLLAEQAQRVAAAEAALHPKETQLSDAEVEMLRADLHRRLVLCEPAKPQEYNPLAKPEAKPDPEPDPSRYHRAPPPVSIRRL